MGDTERYRKEMDVYNENIGRLRIEATPYCSSANYMYPAPHHLQYYQSDDKEMHMYHDEDIHAYPNPYIPLQDGHSHATPFYHAPPSGSCGNAYLPPYQNNIGSCFSNSYSIPFSHGYTVPIEQMHPYSNSPDFYSGQHLHDNQSQNEVQYRYPLQSTSYSVEPLNFQQNYANGG